jgi:hypothetical protein
LATDPRRSPRCRRGGFVATDREELFLAEKIYGGDCRHELIRIDYSNRFRDRV